eukprot:1144290-Pleurochrysis_carterae.AAC.3
MSIVKIAWQIQSSFSARAESFVDFGATPRLKCERSRPLAWLRCTASVTLRFEDVTSRVHACTFVRFGPCGRTCSWAACICLLERAHPCTPVRTDLLPSASACFSHSPHLRHNLARAPKVFCMIFVNRKHVLSIRSRPIHKSSALDVEQPIVLPPRLRAQAQRVLCECECECKS